MYTYIYTYIYIYICISIRQQGRDTCTDAASLIYIYTYIHRFYKNAYCRFSDYSQDAQTQQQPSAAAASCPAA